MEKQIIDKELGCILIRINARARHILFRTADDAILATIPSFASKSDLLRAVKELKPRLLMMKEKSHPVKVIGWDYSINSDHFKLSLVAGNDAHFYLRRKDGKTFIVCPSATDFSDETLIAFIRKAIIEAMRQEAKIYLPGRLHKLSLLLGLSYHTVFIKELYSRWGSCSNEKNINLSLFLMLLPDRLIDYVIFHELTHLREMNHGPNFWALLNSFTSNQALKLSKEVKDFRDPFIMKK